MRTALLRLALACCTATSVSCSSSTTVDQPTDAATDAATLCATDPRTTAFHAGISAKSSKGTFTVAIVDATPAPPARDDNSWNLALTDATGAPLSVATLTVKTFMPDHGHGSSIVPVVTPLAAKGSYSLSKLNLFMPGVWQITFVVSAADGTTDTAVFTFCVAS